MLSDLANEERSDNPPGTGSHLELGNFPKVDPKEAVRSWGYLIKDEEGCVFLEEEYQMQKTATTVDKAVMLQEFAAYFHRLASRYHDRILILKYPEQSALRPRIRRSVYHIVGGWWSAKLAVKELRWLPPEYRELPIPHEQYQAKTVYVWYNPSTGRWKRDRRS